MLKNAKNFWRNWKAVIKLYLLVLALSYAIAFVAICLVWYVYEQATLGHLNQNHDDTVTALVWSFPLMVPTFFLFFKKLEAFRKATKDNLERKRARVIAFPKRNGS